MNIKKNEILQRLDAMGKQDSKEKPEEGQETATLEETVQETEATESQVVGEEAPESIEESESVGPITLAELAQAQEMDVGEFLSTCLGEVTINGKRETKPLKDIVAGYQRQTDSENRYQEARKLAAQAQEQTALIHERAAALDQKLAEAESYLTGEEKQLKAQEEAIDWATLQRDDPDEYRDKRLQFLERKQALKAKQQHVMAERQQQLEEQRQAWEQHRQQHLTEQKRLLLEGIPEWADKQTFETESEAITNYLKTYGASDQDIVEVGQSSAWLLRALRDGYLHSKLEKSAPGATKRIKKIARVVKPGATPDQSEIAERDKRSALNKLHATRGQRRGARDPAVMAAAKAIGIGKLRR